MRKTPNRPREFADALGEQQRSGDPRVYGLGPPPQDIPVGVAPPSPLQVQSVFDTRPMAAFDFAFETQLQISNEVPAASGSVQIPDGFTAVLRRVDLESYIGLLAAFSEGLTFNLLRNDATIPYNEVNFPGVFTEYMWHTHHVFGFWESMGARLGGAPPVLAGNLLFKVRFFGTLIPSRSLPAADEVGSDPVLIREYQPTSSGAK